MMQYNEENLEKISNIIKNNLTIDLIPKKWQARNISNPMFGHCHTASGCLYKIFGSKAMHLYRGLDDEGIWHWWVKDLNDKIIDLTEEQYTSQNRIAPHDKGEKAGLLGFQYKKRVMKLYERVMAEMNNERLNYLYNNDIM